MKPVYKRQCTKKGLRLSCDYYSTGVSCFKWGHGGVHRANVPLHATPAHSQQEMRHTRSTLPPAKGEVKVTRVLLMLIGKLNHSPQLVWGRWGTQPPHPPGRNKRLSPLLCHTKHAACRLVAKLLGWNLEGLWFKPQCSHNKISAAVVPLSKALNPTLLRGDWPLLSVISCPFG